MPRSVVAAEDWPTAEQLAALDRGAPAVVEPACNGSGRSTPAGDRRAGQFVDSSNALVLAGPGVPDELTVVCTVNPIGAPPEEAFTARFLLPPASH